MSFLREILEVVSKPHLTPNYGLASFLEIYAHPAIGGTALSKNLAALRHTLTSIK
jgi:hypothetical protein